MKKTFLISMMLCFLVTSCGGEKNIPAAFPSITPESSSTATATSTMTSTPTKNQTAESVSTPTFTPFPSYATKKVVFEYYTVGNLSPFDSFYAEGYSAYPKLILYDDGQMLIDGGQKVLSTDETQNFLSKLDSLGFFSFESNQKHDEEDKLYDFGNQYEEVNDGLKYCIFVNADKSRNLCVYEPYLQFVIPEMKRILQYLDEYELSGLTAFYPDRILLSIQPVDPVSDELPENATPWDNRFPSLDFPSPRTYVYDTPPSIMYIEGDMAKEIYMFVQNSNSRDVFIQDGKKYIVQVDAVLPHETVINAYQ